MGIIGLVVMRLDLYFFFFFFSELILCLILDIGYDFTSIIDYIDGVSSYRKSGNKYEIDDISDKLRMLKSADQFVCMNRRINMLFEINLDV